MNGASPSILTSSTGTASVFTTNALTGNLFSAATSIGIGASSGTTTINNANLTLPNGQLNINTSTPTIVSTNSGSANVFNTTTLDGKLFGAATTIAIGASTGTLTLNNVTITAPNATSFNMNGASPSIVTTSTGTASVFNTSALTGNLFGVATTIGIGASATAGTTVTIGANNNTATNKLVIGAGGTSAIATIDVANSRAKY
jgi:hypothetical protein